MRALRFLASAVLALGTLVASPERDGWGPPEASAAVSLAVSLDELVLRSRAAVVAVARERTSQWEEVGGSRRIVTYTRLEVQDTLFRRDAAAAPEPELWLRTLGGAVGDIGQQVSGEAQFTLGKRALVFVGVASDGVLVVSGMAQGHFPIDEADAAKGTPARLRPSPSLGKVVQRPGPTVSVHEELLGRSLDDALSRVRKAKARLDAASKPAK